MQNVLFNLPRVYAKPITSDGSGTPFNLGELSGFDLDIKKEIKELEGQSTFTYLQLTGKTTLSGSFKTHLYSPNLLQLAIGAESTTSQGVFVNTESIVIPSGIPEYEITNGVTTDLGVVMGATSFLAISNMDKVLTAPTKAGEYQLDGNKYIFHADDAGKSVKISYTQSNTAASEVTIKNAQMGETTPVELIFYTVSQKLVQTYTLTNAVLAGLTIGWKVGDFGEASVDFACSARYEDDIALKIASYVKA